MPSKGNKNTRPPQMMSLWDVVMEMRSLGMGEYEIINRILRSNPEIEEKTIQNVFDAVCLTLKIKGGKNPLLSKTDIVRKNTGMNIVLGCVHVPGHNKRLLEEAIPNFLTDYSNEIMGFYLAGDFLDMNTLSNYDKGKFPAMEGLTLEMEYSEGNRVLDILENELPINIHKGYLYGNHEARYLKYVNDIDMRKLALPSPEKALGLTARGYKVGGKWDEDYFIIGNDLHLLHGIYYGDNATKQHITKLMKSVLCYHRHRISSYTIGDLVGYNGGFLGDFSHPFFSYGTLAQKKQWKNGFNVVNVDEDGSVFVEQIICQKGNFYFGGKKY